VSTYRVPAAFLGRIDWLPGSELESDNMTVLSSIIQRVFNNVANDSSSSIVPGSGDSKQTPLPASAEGASLPVPPPQIDIFAVVEAAAAGKKEKLNWQTSIVDLMKALDLNPSLEARKELAQELHYPEDMKDTAHMNVWLHKKVLKKLAENGGRLPENFQT
jgi:hypothetical protein